MVKELVCLLPCYPYLFLVGELSRLQDSRRLFFFSPKPGQAMRFVALRLPDDICVAMGVVHFSRTSRGVRENIAFLGEMRGGRTMFACVETSLVGVVS